MTDQVGHREQNHHTPVVYSLFGGHTSYYKEG